MTALREIVFLYAQGKVTIVLLSPIVNFPESV